jgi:hypothetical protein
MLLFSHEGYDHEAHEDYPLSKWILILLLIAVPASGVTRDIHWAHPDPDNVDGIRFFVHITRNRFPDVDVEFVDNAPFIADIEQHPDTPLDSTSFTSTFDMDEGRAEVRAVVFNSEATSSESNVFIYPWLAAPTILSWVMWLFIRRWWRDR